MSEIKITDGAYNPWDIQNTNLFISSEKMSWMIERIGDRYEQIDYGLDILKKYNFRVNNDSLEKMNNDAFYYITDLYNTKPDMMFYKQSDYPCWTPERVSNMSFLLKILYIRSLVRMRFCMYLKTEEPYFFGYNWDYTTTNDDLSSVYTIRESDDISMRTESPTPCNDSKVAILCTHNSNGKIDIDGEVIDIKENRLICFPNNLRYSIITQTDVDRQFLVHINFF